LRWGQWLAASTSRLPAHTPPIRSLQVRLREVEASAAAAAQNAGTWQAQAEKLAGQLEAAEGAAAAARAAAAELQARVGGLEGRLAEAAAAGGGGGAPGGGDEAAAGVLHDQVQELEKRLQEAGLQLHLTQVRRGAHRHCLRPKRGRGAAGSCPWFPSLVSL